MFSGRWIQTGGEHSYICHLNWEPNVDKSISKNAYKNHADFETRFLDQQAPLRYQQVPLRYPQEGGVVGGLGPKNDLSNNDLIGI